MTFSKGYLIFLCENLHRNMSWFSDHCHSSSEEENKSEIETGDINEVIMTKN